MPLARQSKLDATIRTLRANTAVFRRLHGGWPNPLYAIGSGTILSSSRVPTYG